MAVLVLLPCSIAIEQTCHVGLGDQVVPPNAIADARCPFSRPGRSVFAYLKKRCSCQHQSPGLYIDASKQPRSKILRGGALQRHLAEVVPPASRRRVQCHTVISWSNRLSEIRLGAGAAPRNHRATCSEHVLEPGSQRKRVARGAHLSRTGLGSTERQPTCFIHSQPIQTWGETDGYERRNMSSTRRHAGLNIGIGPRKANWR